MEPQVLIYLNGQFLRPDRGGLSVRDLGFLRGFAVFDVMPVVNGKPFLWERHYERLRKSAAALSLSLSVSAAEWKGIVEKLLADTPAGQFSVRTVLSGGPSEDGFVPERGRETLLVMIEPAHEYEEAVFRNGVKIVTLEYERPLPQVKLANHALAISDLPRRREEGAFETLYVKDGMISECSQSNIFVVKEGVLMTTWENVLWGVTQICVLELADALGIPCKRTPLSLDEALEADEIFITGSSKGIVPVTDIDGKRIGSGIPGKTTQGLMKAYREFAASF